MSILVLSLLTVHLLFVHLFPIIGSLLSYLPALLMPFIIGLLIAVLIEPMVIFFEQRLKLNRTFAVMSSLIISIGGFIAFFSILISALIKDINSLYQTALSQSDIIIKQFMREVNDFKLFYSKMSIPDEIDSSLHSNMEQIINFIQVMMQGIINALIKFMGALPGFFVFLIIAAVATFFIIKDRDLIKRFILLIIPDNMHNKTQDVAKGLILTLVGFIRAYGILITITAIVSMIGLKILGVEHVLTIGIIVGLLDLLPILGPFVLFAPWIAWELLVGSKALGIGLLILYGIISIVRQFMEPKILGDSLGLHPLATLMAIYFGFKILGAIGAILGPVSLVVFLACYKAGLFDGLIRRNN